MLGFNGGLMGARRTPTTSVATGLWFQNEQSVAKRAAIWPTTLPSNPIPALSPILWYDFADEATVTTSGTELTQITDKGSRNWTLTKTTTGPQYVTGINSKKCADWGSSTHSNRLRNTSSTSTDVAEMYIVLDAAFDSTFPDYNGLAGGTADPVNLTGSPSAAAFAGFSSWSRAFVNGSTTNTFNSVLPAINSASLLRIKKADDTAVELTTGFQIGMDRNNADRGWFGLIGEVVCFSSVLGSTDRDAVQSFLAAKWSITLV
jgi:hypothetical protein